MTRTVYAGYCSTLMTDTASYSDRRIYHNRMRRQRELRKNVSLVLLTACLVIFLAVWASSFLSNAKSNEDVIYYKYYTSIQVENGDTLWTIAKDHMGTKYNSAEEYVTEVMRVNALKDNTIFAGQHLIIPYYSSEFR